MAKKERISELVKFLSREGQKIVDNELSKVTYTYRTLNLRDSYGWGVYVDGKLVNKGYTATSPGIKKKWKVNGVEEDITGYEAIVEFIEQKYKPHPGIDLVVAVAMPYGEILQDGGGNVKKKYEVINLSRNALKDLASRFKNANFGIISHGSY